MILVFVEKALEQQLSGQEVTSLKDYFRDEMKLTKEEDAALERIAIEYLEAIQPIDAQATQILSQFREQFPEGQVPHGENPPLPPAGLSDIQQQRNAIALVHRDKLSAVVGSTKFSAINKFVTGSFASNFEAIGSKKEGK